MHVVWVLLFVVPVAKIIYGAVTSFYFLNAIVGSWWGGVACMTMCCIAPLTLKNIAGYFVALLLSLAILAIVATATVFDVITTIYFRALMDKCEGDYNLSADQCSCDGSEDQFNRIFQDVGRMQCDNLFAHNTGYLIANAVLSGICVLIALGATFAYFFYFVSSLLSCSKPRYTRV